MLYYNSGLLNLFIAFVIAIWVQMYANNHTIKTTNCKVHLEYSLEWKENIVSIISNPILLKWVLNILDLDSAQQQEIKLHFYTLPGWYLQNTQSLFYLDKPHQIFDPYIQIRQKLGNTLHSDTTTKYIKV